MIRKAAFDSSRLLRPHSVLRLSPRLSQVHPLPGPQTFTHRSYVIKTTADEKIEDLQELYATAKDEFEIASEETEKKTVYAAEDRKAAFEELEKFKAAFEEAIRAEGGEEIKNRIGQRVRELESAVKAMEERAMED